MEIAPADIAKGMQIYSTDGEKLGTVAEVYTGTPAEIEAAGSNDAADATGTLYSRSSMEESSGWEQGISTSLSLR